MALRLHIVSCDHTQIGSFIMDSGVFAISQMVINCCSAYCCFKIRNNKAHKDKNLDVLLNKFAVMQLLMMIADTSLVVWGVISIILSPPNCVHSRTNAIALSFIVIKSIHIGWRLMIMSIKALIIPNDDRVNGLQGYQYR